jgi:archaellin
MQTTHKTVHSRSKRTGSAKPLTRAMIVIAAMLSLVGGVTFAALQSQASKLTGNTIQTAVANLQISPDGNVYSNTSPGFAFSNLIPGGQPVPQYGYDFFLKNAGGTPLALKLTVSSTPSNLDNVDLSKVRVILSPQGGGQAQTFILKDLIDSAQTGGMTITAPGELMIGSVAHYQVQIAMDEDALSGPSASIGNVDFSFGATAVN